MDIKKFMYQKLHDSILKSINFNCQAKQILIFIEPNDLYFENTSLITIFGNGVKFIEINSKEPWGESVFINEIVYDDSNSSIAKLKIEMQSGDLVLMEAELINVEINK